VVVAGHGERLNEPQWNDQGVWLLAFTLAVVQKGVMPLHIMLILPDHEHTVAVRTLAGNPWRRTFVTTLGTPQDIVAPAW
jgi:isoamylase